MGRPDPIRLLLPLRPHRCRSVQCLRMLLQHAGMHDTYASVCECSADKQQTGNTVFAALGVADLPVSSPALAWTKSVCSIVFFLFGSALTALFHRYFGERRRWVLVASFIGQAVLIIIAAYLVQ